MDFVRLAIYNNTHHTPRHGQEAGARSGRGTAMRRGRDAGRWGDGSEGEGGGEERSEHIIGE